MHDGAVIIYNGKILAARCILPVTEKDDLPANYGLRHRAAVGMSEATDTLLIIVSEETGQISTAQGGQLSSALSPQELRSAIKNYMAEDNPPVENTLTKFFRRRAAM